MSTNWVGSRSCVLGRCAVLTICALLTFVSHVSASSIVIPGNTQIFTFGEPNTATYGQTFQTPNATDLVLDSFSFWVNDQVDPDFIDFRAYVYAWDGFKLTGPALYTSALATTSNNGGANGFERFDFNTGGVTLLAGTSYIAFLNTVFDGSMGTGSMAASSLSSYAAGSFYYFNNGSNFSLLSTTPWATFGSTYDLRFEATFSAAAVPEPASLLLLGMGLIGAGVRGRRRRRA